MTLNINFTLGEVICLLIVFFLFADNELITDLSFESPNDKYIKGRGNSKLMRKKMYRYT